MLQRVLVCLVVGVALASLVVLTPSCMAGMGLGMALGGGPRNMMTLPLGVGDYAGQWRGNYVWYDGRWCQYGRDTPYYWDTSNPLWW
jgi:hypothetical protein